MTTFEKLVDDILHGIIYRRTITNFQGNRYVLASSHILDRFNISDIDTICSFAKCLEKNLTYDHACDKKDLDKIIKKLVVIIEKHQTRKLKM